MRRVRIDRDYYSKNRKIHNWCNTKFKPDSWEVIGVFGYMDYIFENDDDFTLFCLTWGHYVSER